MHFFPFQRAPRWDLIWLASLASLKSARHAISWLHQPTRRLKPVSWLNNSSYRLVVHRDMLPTHSPRNTHFFVLVPSEAPNGYTNNCSSYEYYLDICSPGEQPQPAGRSEGRRGQGCCTIASVLKSQPRPQPTASYI